MVAKAEVSLAFSENNEADAQIELKFLLKTSDRTKKKRELLVKGRQQ
jgi:hypothetical protein